MQAKKHFTKEGLEKSRLLRSRKEKRKRKLRSKKMNISTNIKKTNP